jgi:hypothetical protein
MSFIRPDDFKAQPYAYLTNQIGHIGLGVLLVFLASRGFFEVFGEYPVKLHLWLAITAVYFGFVEIWAQGWRGFDTIEDTVFTCVFGAGAPLVSFREAKPGDVGLAVDLPTLDPFFIGAGALLAIGVAVRFSQRSRVK